MKVFQLHFSYLSGMVITDSIHFSIIILCPLAHTNAALSKGNYISACFPLLDTSCYWSHIHFMCVISSAWNELATWEVELGWSLFILILHFMNIK